MFAIWNEKLDPLYAGIGLIITIVISYNILRHWFDQYRISNIQGKYVLITGCDSGFGRKLGKLIQCISLFSFH